MYYQVVIPKAWTLLNGCRPFTWQKQVMEHDKGQNLIDFEDNQVPCEKDPDKSITGNTANHVDLSARGLNTENQQHASTDTCSAIATAVSSAPQAGRPNKSFFEITRVETTAGHNENTGDDAGDVENDNEGDSEMDDTLDHDSSTANVADDSINNSDNISTDVVDTVSHSKPLSVDTHFTIVCDSTSSASSTPPVNSTPATTTEPTSRFRIVKINRKGNYDKGKWTVKDFHDPDKDRESSKDSLQKQSDDIPQSPSQPRRPTGTTLNKPSEQKLNDNGKVSTSPIEPAKSKSSDLLNKGASRGSTSGIERRTSQDR